jgi:hypothetical protein
MDALEVMDSENGRSAAFIDGFTEGESTRARDEVPSPYHEIGMDDYAQGFRAGFFKRTTPQRAARRFA